MEIFRCVEWACRLEANAPKPGNVYPGRDFADLTFGDLLAAGGAIAPVMHRARTAGVGQTILDAVRATRAVCAGNPNLGIILLFAPLCAAAQCPKPLAQAIEDVIAGLSVEDARLAYEAIRLAKPGGLGEATSQDVARQPTVTLLEAMQLAADRDEVAYCYAHRFRPIFELADQLAGCSNGSREEGIVWCFLCRLARRGDTLVRRKLGSAVEQELRERAAQIVAECRDVESAGPRSGFLGSPSIAEFDTWLRLDGHRRNPGTTADLIAAAILVLLIDGRWMME